MFVLTSEGLGKAYSPPQVDRTRGFWGSDYNIPKALFDLPKGDYTL